MIASSDLRNTRLPLNHGVGHMPALGFGTLIPDKVVTISCDQRRTGSRISTLRLCRAISERARGRRGIANRTCRCGDRAGQTSSSPQSCGIPIIGPSAWNRPSRGVWTDSGSSIWISTSFILRLHFNRETSRIRGIKTAMSSTTTEWLCSIPGERWKVSSTAAGAGPSDCLTSL